ncbi:two-component sensor histidine kinase [Psychrosphaera saromensis]|uniref:histidine kinase n=1 Tax=Psychrosphaera saromensis TaxID=716813 RepID=A0A2S7UV97_9GAMM|nr:ATP-binding protein [Psychrosphaera saromensis]PQJ53904.1 hypothetical protein BTO11_09680 [Psychrosphaera saromensis]GHB61477.1 two-component sensor histidine kinase [Psychrosphaera saromensis]GLQ15292.1 two-component sensor histidine kinase [Psychrosphaera saromensis]
MSIQRQLLLLIISAVTLATFFAALHGYQDSSKQLDNVFDQELVSIAEFIASNSSDELSNASPAIETSNHKGAIVNHFVFQVFHQGQLINKSNNAPNEPIVADQQDNVAGGFSEQTFNDLRWRVYSLGGNGKRVLVAQPIEYRILSAESILFVTIKPIVFTIPIIAFLIFYIINKSLKPLVELSQQLKLKSSDDLTQLHVDNLPQELTPVVTRLNSLLVKLDNAFDRERQLTANAAHELRTPISVLAITSHNILQDFNQQVLEQSSLEELQSNVERMAHVIEQIIALYRYSSDNFKDTVKPVELDEVLKEVISNNYEALANKGQNISLLPSSKPQVILGETFALYTLFENLLKNAIKYSGNNSEIQFQITEQANGVNVSIEDNGVGVSDAELDKLFQPFYRAGLAKSKYKQSQVIKGSGLGLSIVKHITDLHHGEINCYHSALGGLGVKVYFPMNRFAKHEA